MPQLPADEGEAPAESEPPEEAMERLAHLEQLVVQLKELIRDKDAQLTQKDTELTNKDAQLKVKIQEVPRANSWESVLIRFLSTAREGGVRSSLHQTQTAGQSQDGLTQQADNGAERQRSNCECNLSRSRDY